MVRAFLLCSVNIVSSIVAIAKNNAIGRDNQLMWHIRDDLKLFKAKTNGHVIIQGRKSYEAIGKPLPNRTNIVITRNTDYKAPGCFVVNSLEHALELAHRLEQKGEIFIIGGAEIYRQSMPVTDKLYISHVDYVPTDAHVFFPDVDLNEWKKIESCSYPQNEGNEFAFEYAEYVR